MACYETAKGSILFKDASSILSSGKKADSHENTAELAELAFEGVSNTTVHGNTYFKLLCHLRHMEMRFIWAKPTGMVYWQLVSHKNFWLHYWSRSMGDLNHWNQKVGAKPPSWAQKQSLDEVALPRHLCGVRDPKYIRISYEKPQAWRHTLE